MKDYYDDEIVKIVEKAIEEHEYNESVTSPQTTKEWMRKDIDNNTIMIEFLQKQVKELIKQNKALTEKVEELSKECYDLCVDLKTKEITINELSKRLDKQEARTNNVEGCLDMYALRIS